MKFYPIPIIRYCYRYVATVVFVILPMYFAFILPFDDLVIKDEERGPFVLLTAGLWIFCMLIYNVAFVESFFATLEVSKTKIIWRCFLRKTKMINIDDLIEVNAAIENADEGIPAEFIYLWDVTPTKDGNPEKGMIRYRYSEELCEYLLARCPKKTTKNLSAYRWQRRER